MSGSKIVDVRFSKTHLQARLADSRIVATPLVWYPSLICLSALERQAYNLLGRGRGVEWKSIDFQLSLEGMLQGNPEHGVSISLPTP